MDSFIFNHCSTAVKNEQHKATFSVLFQCLPFYEPFHVYFDGNSCCWNLVVYYVMVILIMGCLFDEFICRLIALDPKVRFHPPEVNSPI
jgi:hypothetical protein